MSRQDSVYITIKGGCKDVTIDAPESVYLNLIIENKVKSYGQNQSWNWQQQQMTEYSSDSHSPKKGEEQLTEGLKTSQTCTASTKVPNSAVKSTVIPYGDDVYRLKTPPEMSDKTPNMEDSVPGSEFR